MKKRLPAYSISYLLSVLFCLFLPFTALAQKGKHRARINVEFHQNQQGKASFKIKASARINRKTQALEKLPITLYLLNDSVRTTLAKDSTDQKGQTEITYDLADQNNADAEGFWNFELEFKGNDSLRASTKSLRFRRATLDLVTAQQDSTKILAATLKDLEKDSLVQGKELKLKLERLLRPMQLDSDALVTDDKGRVQTELKQDFTSYDGKLIFLMSLEDDEDYGYVHHSVETNWGRKANLDDNFDQRNMWSPRAKTPWSVLMISFTFLIIVWGIFAWLVLTLYRIYKLNT